MKKLLIILTLGLMFGQAKLETRLYEVDMTLYSNEEVELDLNQVVAIGLKVI